jgi:hypothetical protein
MSGEILKIFAIFAPLSVNSSALQINNIKPDIRAHNGSRISGMI